MKSLLLVALAVACAFAHAEEINRLPTKEELVESFSESFKGKLERAKEYSTGNQERYDDIIRRNTVTPEDIAMTAEFTLNSLYNQLGVCLALQREYPKSKAGNCYSGVLMVNGLGHADDQKSIMEAMADKEKLRAMGDGFKNSQAQREMDFARKVLSAGIGGKPKKDYFRKLEEEDVTHALGTLSQFTWLLGEIDFGVNGPREVNIPLKIGKSAQTLFEGMVERPEFGPDAHEIFTATSRQVRVECVIDPEKGYTCFRGNMWLYGDVAQALFRNFGTPRMAGGVSYASGLVKCDLLKGKYACKVTRKNS